MEASAAGRAWRGWRRARGGGSRLSRATIFLFSAFLVRAPASVGYLVRLPRSFRLTQDTVKIVGSSHFPVSVYVTLHQRSPHVLCANQQLWNAELVDPSFQWHGPKGKIVSGRIIQRDKLSYSVHRKELDFTKIKWSPKVTQREEKGILRRKGACIPSSLQQGPTPGLCDLGQENSTAQITSTGSLVFQNFEETMSGVYTCFLKYRANVEDPIKNLQLKYVVYAYREPHYYYQFTARYHAAPCNSIYNISFEKKLLQILRKLVHDLSCEISLLKSQCHRIKMQKAGLQNELFFTFSVSSLDTEKGPKTCKDHDCEYFKRLSKAKHLIERFFNQQVEALGRRAQPLPQIYYIEGTLAMVWINRCFPGYGMNILKHPQCPECCVICSPGSYNPRDGIHCLQCNSSLVYGAKTCP
ncbi:zona pellucida-binding protein 1 isoform X1 [Heterocephalus glaber]|uniref:Zona pellucida-binding protein 1 isoform X1 n=1 Tax=Heterocephalus glaber TaxID=10181 RepID=A0AAX6SJR7_HETGA|nr:zona pellucida-binding protein 1 isoform X1 [Heterocephalus glaber]